MHYSLYLIDWNDVDETLLKLFFSCSANEIIRLTMIIIIIYKSVIRYTIYIHEYNFDSAVNFGAANPVQILQIL